MKLCTISLDSEWDRIVDIYVDEHSGLSSEINNEETFKLLIIRKGVLHLKVQEKIRYILAPAMILLSNKDRLEVEHIDRLESVTMYFKPTVIHDDFTDDRLYGCYFDTMEGTTVYQDYVMLQPFIKKDSILHNIYSLNTSVMMTILTMIKRMNQELHAQRDGYWPCRSRSYLMELLYYIGYSYLNTQEMQSQHTLMDPVIGEMIQYLHEHIADEVTLTELTKQFHMNRNQLNGIFMKQTSMTCLGYMLHMRIDLAKILLVETSLPISEIGERVGFIDTNYFTKVFKKKVSLTPSAYRKNYQNFS